MNRIISVGYLGLKTCYLNISEDDAIARWCKSNRMSLIDFLGDCVDYDTIEFVDEFGSDNIYEK